MYAVTSTADTIWRHLQQGKEAFPDEPEFALAGGSARETALPPIDDVRRGAAASAAFGSRRPLSPTTAWTNWIANQGAIVSLYERATDAPTAETDAGAIRELLTRVAASGTTSLNDAALAALLSGDPGARTVIILFSDGSDRTSWLSEEQVLAAAHRLDTVVYGVVLDSPASTGARRVRGPGGVALRLPNVIDALARDTAGRILTTRDVSRIAGVFRQIFSEFRQRYVLAFEPRRMPHRDGIRYGCA